MPTPTALRRRAEIERATIILADETGSRVRGLRFGAPVMGAEYRSGLVLIGEDVTDICDRYLVRGHNREVWWDIARLLGHEVAHGVAPRSNNALEEAVAETHGRRRARRVLTLLDGAPAAPPSRHWDSAGMYQEQVSWLEHLASWLGRSTAGVAFALKDGRPHRGLSAPARQELLLGRLVEGRLGWRAVAGTGRAARLGAAVARSAGSINVAGRAPVAPRSPVAAIQRQMDELGI